MEDNCFTILCWLMQISHKYTRVSSLLKLPTNPQPVPPHLVVTKHCIELLVLYNNFLLLILHMVMFICQCFDYCRCVIYSEVWKGFTFSFILFLQDCFDNYGSFEFPYNFRIMCSSSVKNVMDILIGIGLDSMAF